MRELPRKMPRGLLVSPRADLDPAAAIAALHKAFDAFKAANDERLNAKADIVLAEKVDRINAAVDECQAALNAVNARIAAASLGAGVADDEAKAAGRFGLEAGTKISVEDYRSYRTGLNAYLRLGNAAGKTVQAAMSVGSDPDGGYSVVPDMSGRIVKKVFETTPMRQLASVTTIGTDRLEGLNDLGENTAGWVGETQPRPATDTARLGKWEIPVHEIYAYPQATQKLLDDSIFDIEAWLADKAAEQFARKENTAFIAGDGVLKPKGILAYPTAATADASRPWGTFEHVGTGTSAGFGAGANGSDKLIDLVYAVKSAYRNGASFLMSRATVGAVRKLKDGQGNYLWQPSLNVLAGGTLLGFPIAEGEDMPAIGASSLSIAFGNFREAYQIVDRIGIRVLRDALTNKPYVGFYTTKRVGGGAISFEALKFLRFA
ncbi:phage major capsid protein [Phreatobacter sp.]|uniref:phage major capsid protein n=1 Tax=Phreatobacter sp. TaxID=1966341 RepID=UPI003F6EFA31